MSAESEVRYEVRPADGSLSWRRDDERHARKSVALWNKSHPDRGPYRVIEVTTTITERDITEPAVSSAQENPT